MKRTFKKTNIAWIAAAILFFAVGCEKDESENRLPSTPEPTSPAKGSVVIPTEPVTLSWKASTDKEGDEIFYTIYYGEDSTNMETEQTYNTSLTLTDYYAIGKKYYWQVEAIDLHFSEPIKHNGQQEQSISHMQHFYTSPTGVSRLADTSGNGFVTLTWEEPENTDHIEISYRAGENGEGTPISVAAGTKVHTFKNLTNETVYTFYITRVNALQQVSMPDTIKAMPLPDSKVRDADFNIYNTFTIDFGDGNTATWTRENLRVTKDWDGNALRVGYVIYINPDNEEVYYSPDELENRSICPKGYHISTDDDWKKLERYMGMAEAAIDSVSSLIKGERGAGKGIAYQLMTKADWTKGEASSENFIIPFFAKPFGYYLEGYGWTGVGKVACFITEHPKRYRILVDGADGISRFTSGSVPASIRCVKD